MIELDEIEWFVEGYLFIEELFNNLLNDDNVDEKTKVALAKGKKQCLDLVKQGCNPKVVMEETLLPMLKELGERAALN